MKKRARNGWLAFFLCFAMVGTTVVPTMTAKASEIETQEDQTLDNDQTANDTEEDANDSEAEGQDSDSENEDTEEETQDEPEKEEGIGVEYQAHVQSYGWQESVKNGELAGTSGEAKRIESIKIQLTNLPEEYAGSSIHYAVHVQSYGWQTAVSDGENAGTTGEAKRLEAIEINLDGPIANDYSVYYRTHVQSYGWLGWAKDGERAGSATYAKRMEAVEIRLVKNGEEAPESDEKAYECPLVKYETHVQSYGWRSAVDNGIGGVTGQAKRVEALKISFPDIKGATGYEGGITYRTHVQGIGWQNWVSDGQLAGTTGQSKRIEALQMYLTGELAEHYDVYYSVHMAKVGWTSYVLGTENTIAGSSNLSKRIEAIKIQLVKKGDASPKTEGTAYIDGYKSGSFYYSGKVQSKGNTGNIQQGNTVGVTGQSKRLEGITLYLDQDAENKNLPTGNIQYASYLSGKGWTDWSKQGEFSGAADGSRGMEAVKIKLSGELSKYYDIYYRPYVQRYGWLGWAKNGQAAGTTKISYRLEALQIRLVSKDAAAPGANSRYYTETRKATCPDAAMEARANLYSSPTNYIIMVDRSSHTVGVFQGSRGFWNNVKYFYCANGKASTPTVSGVFSVGDKGYYFDSGAYRCFWYTQFYGDYLFHSVLCWPNGAIADGRVGMALSHGCVRLQVQNAKWIYDNIPRRTTVVVYN